MAYGLKYSQYITKGGATIQIRVYVKDYSGASYGMAHLMGASLQIIGGQSDPLTPIIKTALSWSLADCWDEGTTQADGTECVNAQGEKCGRWEEFYTPDATKFRVELWAAQTASATPACIWTGYITPDSWSENMIYRGSITLTARDMLGALQEKEFNLTGRVSILDIVQGALSACAAPMALSYTAGHFLVNSNGQSILAHTIAASTFSGDNWQTALEDTLESLGLVLRYNGANGLILAPLRYVREDTTSGSHTIEFTGRSGLRELVPALREITETFDLEIVNIPASDPDESQYAATGGNLTQVVVAHTPSGTFTNTNYIPGYTLTESGGEGWSGGLATPAPGTPIEGIPERKMWFPTDVTDAVQAVWNNPRLRGSYAVKIEQDGPVAWWTGSAPNTHLAPFYGNNTIKEIEMQVVAVVNGTTKYLSPSGSWDTAENTIHYAIGSEINVPDCGAVGAKIIIKKVVTECTYPASRALFVALNLSVQPATEGSTIISEYKTTTEYDEKNNVTITRSPKVGSATLSGCVDFYENVLAYGDAIAPDEWNWPGQSSYYPLAVMIQAQVLCYHAAAASVFTGTAHDKTLAGAFALPGCAYEYYQRGCIPLSATFDFVSGFVGQMNIREVYSWADVWGASFAPEYTQKSGSGKGSTSATGAGGSSVSPGGGGGDSFPRGVNYFELDDTLVRLKGQYDYLGPRKGLIFEGVGENESSDADLYVKEITVGNSTQRVLYSPLPLITEGDQIVGSGTPGGGGGGGGATYMRDLQDVSLTNLSNGQMLAWDASLRSGQGAWKNVPAPTGTITSVALASGTNNGTLKLTVNGVATDNIAVTGWSSKADVSALNDYVAKAGDTMSGNLNIASTTARILLKDTSTGSYNYALSLGFWDGVNNRIENSGRPLLITTYSQPIGIGRDGSGEDIYINTSGNVGVGTTSPAYKLDVNGSLNATTITQNGVALGSNAFSSTAYLPLTGASQASSVTLTRTNDNEVLVLNNTLSGTDISWLVFEYNGSQTGEIGVRTDKEIYYRSYGGQIQTIYHSGNSNKSDVPWACSTLTASASQGVAPLSVTSTTKVTNLNADMLDGFHATVGSNTPYGTIPVITPSGWMDVGRYFEFHYDNTTGSDYSSILECTGNYGNRVALPSGTGTLALTTDNVASATQLQTSRSLWGNLFNGTADVSGGLTLANYEGINVFGGFVNLRYSSTQDTLYAGMKYDANGTEALIFSTGYSNAAILLSPGVNLGTATRDSSYTIKLTPGETIISGKVGVGTTTPDTNYLVTINGGLTAGACAATSLTCGDTSLTSAHLWIRNYASYRGGISYDSNGNEAMIFSTGYSETPFLFCPNTTWNTVSQNSSAMLTIWRAGVGVNMGNSRPSYPLEVYGVIASTGDQVITSDKTKKTNFQDIQLSVKEIAGAPAVTFDWKAGGHSFGSIAQYWKPLLGEMVLGEEGNYTLAYAQGAFVNTIIEAREIEVLKKRVAELEDEVNRLRS